MIREGDTVIIRMHDDESSHMLMVKGTQKLFKRKVDVVGLVGAPYGSIFEVGTNNVTRVKDGTILELDDVADTEIAASGSEGMSSNPNEKKNVVVKGDNSNYNDTNTAQKLTVDEIKKLKAQGASLRRVERDARWLRDPLRSRVCTLPPRSPFSPPCTPHPHRSRFPAIVAAQQPLASRCSALPARQKATSRPGTMRRSSRALSRPQFWRVSSA